jgi:transcriptional regulator with XRE-family HTH domain
MVGKQIKALRKAQKMSQTELGERVGLSRRSISDIENGGNTTLASFMRILHVFSLLDEFMHLAQTNTISPRAAFEAQAKYGLK